MHGAPAFTLVLRPDRRWRWGEVALQAITLAALIGWTGSHGLLTGEILPAAAVATLPGLGVMALLCRHRYRPRQNDTRHLTWAGRPRQWRLDDQIITLDRVADLGSWLLLRGQHATDGAWHPHAVWLALARRDHDPTRWHALRCALQSPGTTDE
jgi:hypothetical protein